MYSGHITTRRIPFRNTVRFIPDPRLATLGSNLVASRFIVSGSPFERHQQAVRPAARPRHTWTLCPRGRGQNASVSAAARGLHWSVLRAPCCIQLTRSVRVASTRRTSWSQTGKNFFLMPVCPGPTLSPLCGQTSVPVKTRHRVVC